MRKGKEAAFSEGSITDSPCIAPAAVLLVATPLAISSKGY